MREIAAGLHRIGVQPGDRVSLLVQPGADLTAVLYACLRIGAVVVVADAGLGLRGLTRAVRGARPDHVIGALARPRRRPRARLARPEDLDRAASRGAAARALGVSLRLGRRSLALGGPRPRSCPTPPAARRRRRRPLHLRVDRPGQGRRLHARASSRPCATRSPRSTASAVGTGLVAGFAPFALLGPALGARSVTPDMDVTAPETLTASAVAAAVAAVDATVVFLSPAALANVVATAGALDRRPTVRALAGVRTFLSAGAPVSEQLLSAASRAHAGRDRAHALRHDRGPADDRHLARRASATASRSLRRRRGRRGTAAASASALPAAHDPRADQRARRSTAPPPASPQRLPGVTGEIVVSAPHLKDHYDRLWLTNRAVRARHDVGQMSGRRWHRTGDVGHLDAAGRLWVEGRLPHVITTADGVRHPGRPRAAHRGACRGVARAAAVGVGPGRRRSSSSRRRDRARPRAASVWPTPALAAAVRGAAGEPVAAVLVVPKLPTDIRHNSKIDRTAARALGRAASSPANG